MGNIGGSSNGRTAAFGAVNHGSNPCPPVCSRAENWRDRKRIDALPYGFEARSDAESAGEAVRAGPGDHLAATAAMMSRRGIHVPQPIWNYKYHRKDIKTRSSQR